MSLESLDVRNFQNHEKRTIEFDPRITIFVGPSDRGKSAILRTIRWVCLNQPHGAGYIRRGSKGARARLVCDGTLVLRKRTVSDNLYKLQEDEYRSFGTKVPDAIGNFLNIGPENFISQHDPAFWFSLSAAQVSREMNAIIQLDVIDRSLAKSLQVVKQCKSEVALTKRRLDEARQKRDSLEWVADIHNRMLALENQQLLLADKRGKVDRLRHLIHEIEGHEKSASVVVPDIKELEQLKTKLIDARERKDRLKSLIEEIQLKIGLIVKWEKELKILKRRFEKLTAGRCPICGSESKKIPSY